MLELKGVSRTFGGVRAVQDVSMTLAAGEVRGLIGPNGAGKTTLINLISGFLAPSAGSMTLDGERLDGLPPPARARKGLARTFQNPRIFPGLTVQQNIDVAGFAGTASGRAGGTLWQEALHRFGLADKRHEPAGTLAYGHRRQLEIVRALALRPRVLMLDEPAAGLNEHETPALGEALGWVHGQTDCAILVIDHDLKFIMALSRRMTVLNMGQVIAEGTPQQVARNRQVIDAYLGEDDACPGEDRDKYPGEDPDSNAVAAHPDNRSIQTTGPPRTTGEQKCNEA